MSIRFLLCEEDGYKLLGYMEVKDFDVMARFLHDAKDNEWDIGINTEGIVDTDTDIYTVHSFEFVVPKVGGELLPHIAVYLEG